MCIVFTLCFNIFPWKESRDFMWSFCIYCILHAKFPIPEITTPYAAMHQFPEKLNCLAIVQEFITPPLTVSCIKMTGCPLCRYPRDLVSPDRGGRQLRILPRHPQSPGPGEQSTLPVIYLYLGEVMQLKHSQLLDELAILWVVMACYWLWYPEFALPPPYR